jgi:Thiol-activated cytolysin
LAKYVGPGNPATFIESVTYGRIFYLLVQSTSSAAEVNAKVTAFVQGAVNTGGSVEVTDLSSLEQLDVKGYALGGNAGLAQDALMGDYQAVRNFLAQGGDYRTGVPLSYVVRSLARPDMIVNVKVNTEYDEINCTPVGRSLEKPLFWYRADHPRIAPVDVGGLKCVTTWYNMFPDTTMHAVPLNLGHYGGEFRPNALSSTTGPKPAILCYQDPAHLMDGIFKYKEDNRFINANYTVFALMKLDKLAIPYPTYVLFGTSSEPSKNLSIGFWDQRELVISHQDQLLTAALPSSYSADRFNVYTFRFSKDEGMSIYVGLESEPIAHDPNARIPLSVYVHPQFGSSSGSAVWIVELMAYGIAATDAQRLAMVRQISDRYIW